MTIKNISFYRILCMTTRESYIGCTSINPFLRLKFHIGNYKRWKKGFGNCCSSYKILERDNYVFNVIDKIPANIISVSQIKKKEAELIAEEKSRRKCVNKIIPGRTQSEYRADNRVYINSYARDFYHDYTKYEKRHCIFCKKDVMKKYYSQHIHTQKHIKNITLYNEVKDSRESKKESKISDEIEKARMERHD